MTAEGPGTGERFTFYQLEDGPWQCASSSRQLQPQPLGECQCEERKVCLEGMRGMDTAFKAHFCFGRFKGKLSQAAEILELDQKQEFLGGFAR